MYLQFWHQVAEDPLCYTSCLLDKVLSYMVPVLGFLSFQSSLGDTCILQLWMILAALFIAALDVPCTCLHCRQKLEWVTSGPIPCTCCATRTHVPVVQACSTAVIKVNLPFCAAKPPPQLGISSGHVPVASEDAPVLVCWADGDPAEQSRGGEELEQRLEQEGVIEVEEEAVLATALSLISYPFSLP